MNHRLFPDSSQLTSSWRYVSETWEKWPTANQNSFSQNQADNFNTNFVSPRQFTLKFILAIPAELSVHFNFVYIWMDLLI